MISRKQFFKLFLASAMAGTMSGRVAEAVELPEEDEEQSSESRIDCGPYFWDGGVSAPPGGRYYAAWDKRAGQGVK